MIAIDRLISNALESARVRPIRRLREWTEQEVYIPDGPYKGERFRIARQPFAGLLFDELDSGRWPETFIGGPSQTGKTLIGHVIPTIHAVAEHRRNVVLATPDMRMATNKWEIDFLPVLAASPTLAALIPTSGPGSRGGQIKDSVRLTNGATIKWMTAGGDDTQRAGYTAEGGVFVTEAARFSTSGENSVEADPLDQLRARMQALPRRRRRLVVEGTFTIDEELPATAMAQSSRSRIALPCPHCSEYVSLEREHLHGWREATSELQAYELARYACPSCGVDWTEEQRGEANARGVLLHGDQTIDKRGIVSGETPQTERLFFRWTMGNNMLLTAGDVAVDEWKAAQLPEDSEARENAERKLCQFVWARTYKPKTLDGEPLTANRVATRQDGLQRGVAPEDTQWITVGVDLGKYFGHYVVVAWLKDGRSQIIDYGIFDVPTKRNSEDDTGFDERVAIGKALATLRERFETLGWTKHKHGGEVSLADKVLIDSGNWTDVVRGFVRQVSSDGRYGRASEVYVACRGVGVGGHDRRNYTHPTRRGNSVIAIGERYFVAKQPTESCHVVEIDANYWKSWVHERLQSPVDQRGGMALFAASAKEHNTFAKHLTNEQMRPKPVPRFGIVNVWENQARKPNHFFDALVYACVAGHMSGFRLLDEAVAAAVSMAGDVPQGSVGIVMPDGRSFYDLPNPSGV